MKRRAVVIGTGGHARAVLSILASVGDHDVIGLLDLERPREGEVILGVPVIGGADTVANLRDDGELDAFLAIGTNALRRVWWERIRHADIALPNLVSPHAIVDAHARMGSANIICARAFVGPDAEIGDNNLLNTGTIIEHETRVGSHCHLAPSSTISGRSVVGDGCFVGAGATIIDRIEIAPETTVGAGATVVVSITDAGGTHVGTPARPIRPGVAARGSVAPGALA